MVNKILAPMRSQLMNFIKERYVSIEDFCRRKNVSTATIYNFLKPGGTKDFRVSTLGKIAEATERELKIEIK